MSLSHVLETLIAGASLSRGQATDVMRALIAGETPEPQVAGFLVALQVKGATAEELAGFADVLRENALALATDVPLLVDTCGTGGGRLSFNVSTGAAILAAAAGAKVAKHGNRSVTSHCGSADVLEALGVSLHADTERLGHLLRTLGIAFLFAPNHHPALARVGHVRKALGVRTVFNQLGPLANPAGARRQIVGVYDRTLVGPMADALALLGTEWAFVVHGEDGLDEASPVAPTVYAEVRSGQVSSGRFLPADFGLPPLDEDVLLPGSSVAENADVLRAALGGTDPHAHALLPTAALALLLSERAGSVADAARLARETLDSGAASHKLNELVEASGE